VLDEMPVIRQAIIGRGEDCVDQDAFERKLLVIRMGQATPDRDFNERLWQLLTKAMPAP